MVDVYRKPLESKKFLSYMFSMLVIAGIIVTALMTQPFGWAMATFMVVGAVGLCGLAIGYILSQAALDQFLHTIQNVVDHEHNEKDESNNGKSKEDSIQDPT
jgi:hypothetical protein